MNHLEVNLKTNTKSVAYVYISSFYSLASFCVILVIWTILGANLSLEACFCKGLKNPNSGEKKCKFDLRIAVLKAQVG